MSGSATASIDIQVIGDTNEHIFLLANPSTLPSGGGTTELTAAVTDSIGNPLQGERVLFSTDQGVLKSNGQFVTTDSQGHASDELTTNQTANVKAEVVDVSADPATVNIPVGSVNIECSFTVNPQNPVAGQAVTFTDTTQIDPQLIFSSIWDFGDGKSGSGVSVQHTYSNPGTFTVAHVLVDVSNNNYTCTNLRLTVQ
jgi:PKD repeat protein